MLEGLSLGGISLESDFGRFFAFLAVVVGFALLSKLAKAILIKIIGGLAEKTKTILDNLLLDALAMPLSVIIVIGGFYAGMMLSWPEQGQSMIAIFKIALVVWSAATAYRIVKAFLHWYVVEVAPKYNLSMTGIETTIRRVSALFLISMSAIMILDALGIEVTPLIASLGIAGLAVALAFQDTLSNFFAGIHMSVDKPVREGDFIQLETGQEGQITKIGWRSTQIRLLANNMIYIPNAKLAQSVIMNFSVPTHDLSVGVPVSVSYDSDLEHVEKVTREVASGIQKSATGAVRSWEPKVRFKDFADSGIGINVILRVESFEHRYTVISEFIKALHKRFGREKIEIPYPKRSVYIEKMPGEKPAHRKK